MHDSECDARETGAAAAEAEGVRAFSAGVDCGVGQVWSYLQLEAKDKIDEVAALHATNDTLVKQVGNLTEQAHGAAETVARSVEAAAKARAAAESVVAGLRALLHSVNVRLLAAEADVAELGARVHGQDAAAAQLAVAHATEVGGLRASLAATKARLVLSEATLFAERQVHSDELSAARVPALLATMPIPPGTVGVDESEPASAAAPSALAPEPGTALRGTPRAHRSSLTLRGGGGGGSSAAFAASPVFHAPLGSPGMDAFRRERFYAFHKAGMAAAAAAAAAASSAAAAPAPDAAGAAENNAPLTAHDADVPLCVGGGAAASSFDTEVSLLPSASAISLLAAPHGGACL